MTEKVKYRRNDKRLVVYMLDYFDSILGRPREFLSFLNVERPKAFDNLVSRL